MSDIRELMSECQKENPLAQKELYDTYAPLLLGICLRYAKDSSEAEDVLQDAFLKIFEYVKDFDYTGSISAEAWMKKIVVNMAISNYRKNLKRYYQEDIDTFDSPSYAIEYQQCDFTEEELLGVIANLPPRYKMVFNLYAIEGYKHKEIAEMLDIDPATSKSQYSRAKKKIQAALFELKQEKQYE